MTTRKLSVLILVVVVQATAGCAEGNDPAQTPPPDPAVLTHDVDMLAARVADGADVGDHEFGHTLAPFENESFDRWPERELGELISSFQRLRTSLVSRYHIVDPICTDDSWVRYSLCEPGYPCVAAVQLAELHCLWFVAH